MLDVEGYVGLSGFDLSQTRFRGRRTAPEYPALELLLETADW